MGSVVHIVTLIGISFKAETSSEDDKGYRESVSLDVKAYDVFKSVTNGV